MRDSDPVVTPQRFPIRIGRRSQLVLLLFGVRPANAYVDLGGDEIDAHFGFFRFRTPTSNLASWRIEGPWRWITAIGVRFSVHDHDLTFGGTNRGGVRVGFREPVSQLGVRVPALYLTVEDIEGFAAALAERGLPGTDTRRPACLAMPDAGQDDALAHAADRDPLASLGRTSAARTSHSHRRSDPRMHIGVVAGGLRMSVSGSQADQRSRLRTSSPSDEADRAVLARLADGELDALEDLYDRYKTMAYSIAYRITNDATLAEDVVQDAFLGVWRNAARYIEGRGSVKTWLLTIVHHRAIDAIRRRRRMAELPDVELPPPGAFTLPDVWAEVAAGLDAEIVRGALEALSDVQREAIELAYFGGLTQQDIADRTATPLGTVKSRMRLGLLAMRRNLEAGSS